MDAKRHFCTTCETVMQKVGLFDVPRGRVALFLEFLKQKGLRANLMEGWYFCPNCGGYMNMPTVEAVRQKFFT